MKETVFIVNLDTIDKVKEFVSIVSKFNEEVTIKSENYEVDAKSTLALFSLDITKPLIVCLYSDNSRIEDSFESCIEKFKI